MIKLLAIAGLFIILLSALIQINLNLSLTAIALTSPIEMHPLGAKAQSQNCNTHCLFESSFAKQIGVTKDTNEKWAFMEIDSDTNWQGSVLDTSMKSETKAGSGEGTIPFECSSFGIYSLVMQKQTEDGSLHIKVVRNGNLLKEGSTTAPYGLVSLAGQC